MKRPALAGRRRGSPAVRLALQCAAKGGTMPHNKLRSVSIRCAVMATAAAILSLATTGSLRAADDDPPLALARDGFFYVGGKPTMVDGRSYVVGQMYVEMRIPLKQTHPYPIIMVHGGTRTGTTFTGTP